MSGCRCSCTPHTPTCLFFSLLPVHCVLKHHDHSSRDHITQSLQPKCRTWAETVVRLQVQHQDGRPKWTASSILVNVDSGPVESRQGPTCSHWALSTALPGRTHTPALLLRGVNTEATSSCLNEYERHKDERAD